MITFDMAAYFTSLLIYNNYNFKKNNQARKETEKKINKRKTKELEGFQRDQEILPHAKSKETFLNMLQQLKQPGCTCQE